MHLSFIETNLALHHITCEMNIRAKKWAKIMLKQLSLVAKLVFQLLDDADLSSNENSGPFQNPQKEHSHLCTNPTNTQPHSTSPSDEFASDSTKNSLISLFLSHLERKNPVESGDDILGNITDSLRGSDEKAPDKGKNGFVRVYDENSNLSTTLNPSQAGGFPCTVGDALQTCSPNSEILVKQHFVIY